MEPFKSKTTTSATPREKPAFLTRRLIISRHLGAVPPGHNGTSEHEAGLVGSTAREAQEVKSSEK